MFCWRSRAAFAAFAAFAFAALAEFVSAFHQDVDQRKSMDSFARLGRIESFLRRRRCMVGLPCSTSA